MSDSTDLITPRPVLTAVQPQLFVSDIKGSCEFFTQRLGFKVAFVYGEPPFYGQVMRDAVRLYPRSVDSFILDRQRVERDDLLSACLTVATAGEVDQRFTEFQPAGAVFHQKLKQAPWGSRNFIVKDPD